MLPTLVAGIYGMNFQLWPSEQSEWSFPFALALMAILGGAVLFTFKRIGWL
jgi:magnesium transporter